MQAQTYIHKCNKNKKKTKDVTKKNLLNSKKQNMIR